MPDILSQDEIDALLSATGSDEGDSGAAAASQAPGAERGGQQPPDYHV